MKGKNACVVYVQATKTEAPRIKAELEKNGYSVCSVLASLEAAKSAQRGAMDLPDALKRCVEQAQLCVFLVPEEQPDDQGISGAIGFAGQLGKRMIGLVAGSRTVYPPGFEMVGSALRLSSTRLSTCIQGNDIWESEDAKVVEERRIDHQKCQ